MKKGMLVIILMILFIVIIGISFFKFYTLAGGGNDKSMDEKDLIWVWFMIGLTILVWLMVLYWLIKITEQF